MDDSTNQIYQPYQEDERARLIRLARKVGLAAMIIIIVGLVLTFFIRFATTGKLVVKTDVVEAAITAMWSPNGEKGGAVTTVQNGKVTRLKPGRYLVEVKVNHKVVASQTVQMKGGQTITTTLNTKPKMAALEPVANVNTRSFSVDKTTISYLDQATKQAYTINSQNQLLPKDAVVLEQVKWADPGFGIGQDSDGKLFVVAGSTIKPFTNIPFAPSPGTPFAVASDRTVYLVNGSDVYRGTAEAGFQKVYSASNAPIQLFASTNRKFAFQYREANADSSTEATMVVVDDTKKLAEKKVDTYEASWSKSGKYLLATSDEGTVILNSSLELVTAAPNNNVNGPEWIDDNTVFYGIEHRLWRFDMDTGKASVVAEADKDHAIVAIVPDKAKAYVYLSVESKANTNESLVIERYGLNGQTPSHAGLAMQTLPLLFNNGCLLSLLNFSTSKPTILLYGYNGRSASECTQMAKDYALSKGLTSADAFTYTETKVPPVLP